MPDSRRTGLVFSSVLSLLMLLGCWLLWLLYGTPGILGSSFVLSLAAVIPVPAALALWGSSVASGLFQPDARKGVCALSAMLAVWALIPGLSLYAPDSAAPVLQSLQLAVSMLAVPACAWTVHAALDADRPRSRKFYILCAVCAAAAVFCLTNPLHGLIPCGDAVSAAQAVLVMVQRILIAAVLVIPSCRPGIRGDVRTSLIFSAVLVPLLGLPALLTGAGLYALTLSLPAPLLLWFAEVLLCRLSPDGSRWPKLIQASEVPMQFLAQDGSAVWTSESFVPVTAVQKNAILENRLETRSVLDAGISVTAYPIRNGILVIEEDVSDLNQLQASLCKAEAKLSEEQELILRQEAAAAECDAALADTVLLEQTAAVYRDALSDVAALYRFAGSDDTSPMLRRRTVHRGNTLLLSLRLLIGLQAEDADVLSVSCLTDALEKLCRQASRGEGTFTVHTADSCTIRKTHAVILFRCLTDLILNALEGHWAGIDISFRAEPDTDMLVCLAAASAAMPEAAAAAAEKAEALLSPAGGSASAEQGKASVRYTIPGGAEHA